MQYGTTYKTAVAFIWYVRTEYFVLHHRGHEDQSNPKLKYIKPSFSPQPTGTKPAHQIDPRQAGNQGGATAKPRGGGTGGGGGGLLDLEGHYAFYGAYHSNPVNVGIHELFVWPIFLTALLLLHLTAPSAHAAGIGAAVYGAYYFLLDRRAGALAALLCFLCWAASGALAARLGFSVGWKVVLVAQLFCWTMQFIGHGVFEKRAPALLDNLVQAFLMAPFFVLLEILHTFGGYEPYPGFHDKVTKLIEEARKEWEDKKSKKSS